MQKYGLFNVESVYKKATALATKYLKLKRYKKINNAEP